MVSSCLCRAPSTPACWSGSTTRPPVSASGGVAAVKALAPGRAFGHETQMSAATAPLPIDDVLPGLLSALERGPFAVLVAPPGAGKTTRVPLALLQAGWRGDGRIIVLEPRRLATRAAARRMAASLGEDV